MERKLGKVELHSADVRKNGDGAHSVYVDLTVNGDRQIFTGTRLDRESGRRTAAHVIWQARRLARNQS